MILKKTRVIFYLLLPITMIASSCGIDPNVAKVAEFSQNAPKAKDALGKLNNEFYQSCLRTARYQAVNLLPPDLENGSSEIVAVDELKEKLEKLEQRLENDPSNAFLLQEIKDIKLQILRVYVALEPNQLQRRVNDQKSCNETEKFDSSDEPQIRSRYLWKLMETGNNVIVGYIEKLGELAGTEVNFDDEFKGLKTSAQGLATQLQDLFSISPQENISGKVGAGVDIANFIVTSIFRQKKLDTLKESITNVNEPLRIYAEGLQTVVKRTYIDGSLSREENALDQYYIDYISEILASNERLEGDSVIAIANTLISIDQDRWNPEKDLIQERREFGYSYINVLQNIIDGHQELANIYGAGETPSPSAINKVINSNQQALKEFVQKADKLKKLEKQLQSK